MFEHHGASPHWGLEVVADLDEQFTQRWLGRDDPIPWQLSLPDIALLDFFLLGYVKYNVQKSRFNIVNDFKTRIVNVDPSINEQMFKDT